MFKLLLAILATQAVITNHINFMVIIPLIDLLDAIRFYLYVFYRYIWIVKWRESKVFMVMKPDKYHIGADLNLKFVFYC